MTTTNNDFLIASVNLPSIEEKQLVTQQILALQKKQSKTWDKARNINVVQLVFYDPVTGHTSWNKAAPPLVKHWTEKHVFPWIGYRTKLVALIVPPMADAKMHVDCGIKEIGTLQHRFRLMLQGNTTDIYYKTDRGEVNVPEILGPYIMEAGYPHAMRNTASEPAVLLAFGSPWHGKDCYEPDDIDALLSRRDYGLPVDADQYVIY
jgi:hypothetical protein